MVQNTGKLQWHPAFDAALHIELEEDLNILDIKNEYTLSKKPMQLDILIVKKEGSRKVKKTFGHIFRQHNIIEYKSPEDYLSINDFYKVYGYTLSLIHILFFASASGAPSILPLTSATMLIFSASFSLSWFTEVTTCFTYF